MKTLRCIFTELKRILTSPYFLVGVVIMAAVCCTKGIYTTEDGRTYNVLEAVFKLPMKDVSLFAENICCQNIDGYGLMFIGIIASFPFIFVSCGEQKNGLRFSIYRKGVFRYALSKTVSAVLSAGLVCGLGYLLYTGIVFLLFPSGNFSSSVSNGSFLSQYMKYLLGAVLSGMSVSMLPLVVSSFTGNKYLCVCIPFFIDYFRMTLGNRMAMGIDWRSAEASKAYDKIVFVYSDYMSKAIWGDVWQIMLGFAIFLCMLFISFAAVYFLRKGCVDIGA